MGAKISRTRRRVIPEIGVGDDYSSQERSNRSKVQHDGYAPNGNIVQHVNSIMGTWSFSYDAVDRLMTATPGAGVPSRYAGMLGCWGYDTYGNRTLEAFSTGACNNNPTPQVLSTYNTANNRIINSTFSPNTIQGVGTFGYDASGNTNYDGKNSYWYDAEGQLCAVQTAGGAKIQYVYDAEGARIAQGTLTAVPGTYATCAPLSASGSNLTSSAGFSLTKRYLVDEGGQQVTELNASAVWQHSNVFAGGKLVATYDTKGIHFEISDPLGTKRIQANIAGQIDETCTSLPFGNDLSNPLGAQCSAPVNGLQTNSDATEHHFTQKERDSDTGNDYFFARYYASALGRFTTPDWSAKIVPVPYAKLENPQTLNLYVYVGDDPLTRVDPDGHGCHTIHGVTVCFGDPPPLPPPPPGKHFTPKVPSSNLHTDMSGHTTTFTSTDMFGNKKNVQIETHNDVDSRAKPGAKDAYSTPNIQGVDNRPASKEYGPKGAKINTNDPRGRQIHGGGSKFGVPGAYADHQGWAPTMGCTRGQNIDVTNLGQSITESQHNPYESGIIPYSRNNNSQ